MDALRLTALPAWRRWVYAAKPASWPKLLVPCLLGQALGVAASGRLDLLALTIGLTFTVLDLVYVVFLNDWSDRRVDAIKRQLFPDGCSPKTIPDGILPAGGLLRAGLAAGAAALAVCALGAAQLERPALLGLGALCLLLFAAYSLPPLRLNYRGGGELLEMLGVGLALPVFNAYAQAGEAAAPLLIAALPGFALLALSSAIASGLSDEVSDREGGKQTIATWLGNPGARRACGLAALGGALGWLGAAAWLGWPALVAGLVAAAHLISMQRASAAAVTNAFREQARYKQRLHRAIWHGGLALAVGLLLGDLA